MWRTAGEHQEILDCVARICVAQLKATVPNFDHATDPKQFRFPLVPWFTRLLGPDGVVDFRPSHLLEKDQGKSATALFFDHSHDTHFWLEWAESKLVKPLLNKEASGAVLQSSSISSFEDLLRSLIVTRPNTKRESGSLEGVECLV